MKLWRLICLSVLFSGLPLFVQGCAFTAGAVAGAAGAEAIEDEGYELRSPIEETDDN